MNAATKKRLAQALEVDPADIREFRQAPDGGYNVVLVNYQKFNNVEPAPAPARKQPQKTKQPGQK